MARKALGLAFSGKAIRIAEVHPAGESFRLARAAVFPVDAVDDAPTVGKKLGQFLKQQQFTATEAVIGLPAQWLMLREKTLPPAAPEMLCGILRLQAERDFSFEPEALALDYATGTPVPEGLPVVLVATLKERTERAKAIAHAAGVKVSAITSTALALQAASGVATGLYFGGNGLEWTTRGANGLPVVRHLSGQPTGDGAVAGELLRSTAHMPALGRSCTAWDDVGADTEALSLMAAGAGLQVKPSRVLSGLTADAGAAQYFGSAALALQKARGTPSAIDFMRSRMDVKPQRKLSKRAVYGLAAAGLALLLFGYLIYDWQSLSSDVSALKESRDGMKESVETAKEFVDRVQHTGTWYAQRPNYLECLRTITLTFPEDGRVWTSNLTLREDMKGVLSARATDEKSVLDVMDKMKLNPALAGVKMLHMRSSGTKTHEVSFSVSFDYTGAGPK